MRNRCLLLAVVMLLCWFVLGSSAMAAEPAPAPENAEHEALPLHAVPLVRIGKFGITNSMLVTWIVAAGVIILAQTAMRNPKRIPGRRQNFWEWLVEGLYNFLEGIIGRKLVQNRPLLRGGNADLNMTTAMAAVFFVLWTIWAIQANGIGGFLLHLFGPKGETTGFLKVIMVVIFFLVGWLEVISILFRPVSLSFRLFGNIYAGESTLEVMSRMVPALSWLLPIPFYFLEILVGIVQALVFMLLTAVFTLLIVEHESETAHS